MNKPKVIYTNRSRLLEALEEARIKDKAEHPEIREPWFGSNYGFTAIERATGIYHNTLYRALNGNGNLTINTLIRLANYTGVSIDYLLGLSDRKFLPGREPRGHWLFDESGQVACSNCHNILLRKRNENVDMRYCPNCGADMKGGAKC